MTYTVIVTREGKYWLGDIPDLSGAHAFARNLTALDKEMHDVISLVLDHDDDEAERFAAQPLSYEYEGVPPVVHAAAQLGDARRSVVALAPSMERCAKDLAEDGFSVRDIAHLLAVTPGYVSQLTTRTPQTKAA